MIPRIPKGGNDKDDISKNSAHDNIGTGNGDDSADNVNIETGRIFFTIEQRDQAKGANVNVKMLESMEIEGKNKNKMVDRDE